MSGLVMMEGTRLPNVRKATLVEVGSDAMFTRYTPGGAYMWPNGWVTLYTEKHPNTGVLVPPWRVFNLWFGPEEVNDGEEGP